MTIQFTQPGDVAFQVYNAARGALFSYEDATTHAWEAMQAVKEDSDKSEKEEEFSDNPTQK